MYINVHMETLQGGSDEKVVLSTIAQRHSEDAIEQQRPKAQEQERRRGFCRVPALACRFVEELHEHVLGKLGCC